jgi:hypothetical protein
MRHLGRDKQARQASLRSLEIDPRNNDAKIWLAIDAARNSQHQELGRLLKEIGNVRVRTYFQKLLRIAQIYHDALEGIPRAEILSKFRHMRMERDTGALQRRFITELSARLIAQSHWLVRPFVWLRYNLV